MASLAKLTALWAAAAAVSLTASAAASQPLLIAEQQALTAVDQAVGAFRSPNPGDDIVQVADRILDTVQRARDAFALAERARDAADDRYHTANADIDTHAVTCSTGYRCRNNQLLYSDALAAAHAELLERDALVSDANADYADATNTPGADEARTRARRLRRFANIIQGLRSRADFDRQLVLVRSARSTSILRGQLHSRATSTHVVANQHILNAVATGTRTISSVATQLVDRNHPTSVDVLRAVETADASLANANEAATTVSTFLNPGTSPIPDQIEPTISLVLNAARTTMAALRMHLNAVEMQATQNSGNPPVSNNQLGDNTAPDTMPDDFATWVTAVNAAVEEAERAADDAEAVVANTEASPFARMTACISAVERVTRAIVRTQNLTSATDRPAFLAADVAASAYDEIRERVDAAQEHARSACYSIQPSGVSDVR